VRNMSKEYSKAFYRSKQWLKARAGYIASVNGLCERCLKKSIYTPGYIVHHKKPITPDNIHDHNITLNWDNLEYVCLKCHNYIHYGQYDMRDGVKFDNDGNIVQTREPKEIKVYIVWGSPGSGKNTYVDKLIEYNDMLIDLDKIREAIGSTQVDTALKVREFLYGLIRDRDIKCNNVWVVAGLPNRDEREALKRYLKATEMIYIEATQDECIKRAMADKNRKDKALQRKIIEKWFSEYN